MKRFLIAIAIALLASAIPTFAGWQSRDSNYNAKVVTVGGTNGFILMVDGTSLILQTDAASKICRAGGC